MPTWREAGVSVSTVSRVINGTRRVSPATARAVIDATDYRADVFARSLNTGLDALYRDRHFGHRQSLLHRNHLRDRDRMRTLGHDGFLSDTEDDPARELAVLTALHQQRVDGAILATSADPEHGALRHLRATRCRCLLVDRTPDPTFAAPEGARRTVRLNATLRLRDSCARPR